MKKVPTTPPEGRSYQAETPGTLLPFLLEHCKDKSRNQVKSMLARGQVLVNGKKATRFDHPVKAGQEITVLRRVAPELKPPFPILYEDEQLLVVNKPAGLLTVATEKEKNLTAFRAMNDYLAIRTPGLRIHVVHRLDRDTSGVLLLSKSHALKLALQENWNELVTVRGYLAVTEGVPPESAGVIRSYLYETSTHLVYSGPPGPKGLEAVTRYTVLRQRDGLALVEIMLETGRKNQIRVHMKQLGCPVVGDKKYGSKTDPLGRLGLHAHKLNLRHPVSGAALEFSAPVSGRFEALFSALG